jgi:hypothetical protein
LHATSSPEIAITAGDDLPLIQQDGLYEATGGAARLANYFLRTIIVVQWTVLVPDATAVDGLRKVKLPQFFNVTVGPGGRIQAKPRSKFWRAWVTVAGRRPTRGDRLAPGIFQGALCKVRVRTVTQDSVQQAITDVAQYSVVDGIVEVIAGGGRRA